jgi:hypothetical protein
MRYEDIQYKIKAMKALLLTKRKKKEINAG